MADDKKSAICRNCGQPEHAHCFFTPLNIPEGCICDLDDWLDLEDMEYLCTCAQKEIINTAGVCPKCDHLRGCHRR